MHIGVDIEDISRFKDKSIENDGTFLTRVYTQNELEYCFRNKNSAQHLAVRFCAKEAVIKAISNIYEKTLPLNKIEILNHSNGSPYVNILENELKNYRFEISLSHEKQKAIAFVIVS